MSRRPNLTNIYVPPMVRPFSVKPPSDLITAKSENSVGSLLSTINDLVLTGIISDYDLLPRKLKSCKDSPAFKIEGYSFKTLSSEDRNNSYYTYTVQWSDDKRACRDFEFTQEDFIEKAHSKSRWSEIIDEESTKTDKSLKYESIASSVDLLSTMAESVKRNKKKSRSNRSKSRKEDPLDITSNLSTAEQTPAEIQVHLKVVEHGRREEMVRFIGNNYCINHTIKIILGLPKGGLKNARVFSCSSQNFSIDDRKEVILKKVGKRKISYFKTKNADKIYLLVDFTQKK